QVMGSETVIAPVTVRRKRIRHHRIGYKGDCIRYSMPVKYEYSCAVRTPVFRYTGGDIVPGRIRTDVLPVCSLVGEQPFRLPGNNEVRNVRACGERNIPVFRAIRGIKL